MMKKYRNTRAEGYIDVCVAVVVFVMLMVVTLNLFSFLNMKLQLDQAADELIEVCTFYGGFTDEFDDASEQLTDRTFDYELICTAEEWYNEPLKRVQLGDKMTLTVKKQTYLKGVGGFKIPVTVTAVRSGLSERYWKG